MSAILRSLTDEKEAEKSPPMYGIITRGGGAFEDVLKPTLVLKNPPFRRA